MQIVQTDLDIPKWFFALQNPSSKISCWRASLAKVLELFIPRFQIV